MVLRKTNSYSLLCRSKVCVRTMIGPEHCMIGRMAAVIGPGSSDFCRLFEDTDERDTVEHILSLS